MTLNDLVYQSAGETSSLARPPSRWVPRTSRVFSASPHDAHVIQVPPAYLTHLLPIQLLGGAGVGLAFPSLIGSGSASLPHVRFDTASGPLNMARQNGTVFAAAVLIAKLARLDVANPWPTFHHGVVAIVAFVALAGVVSGALLTKRTAATTG